MKLKINESRILEFEMDIDGCSWKEIKGYFRFELNNIEYGIPAKIEEKRVIINIPSFSKILNEDVKKYINKNKTIPIKARLDMIANDIYTIPWNGEIEMELPVSIKISEEKLEKKKIKIDEPKIKTKEENTKKEEKIKEENTKKEIKFEENEKVSKFKKFIGD